MIKQDYRKIFIISDLFASGVAWSLFFVYRKIYIETLKFGVPVPIHPDIKFFVSLVLISAFWFLIYYSSGSYSDIRRRSQGKNAIHLFITTITGSFIIFFFVILDDTVISYKNYYQSFLIIFILQFLLTFIFRYFILFYKNLKFRRNKDQFRIVIIGNTNKIVRFCSENYSWIKKGSFNIVGYILEDFTEMSRNKFSSPVCSIENMNRFINELKAEEVFVITETLGKEELETLFLQLFRKDVYIRVVPELIPLLNIPVKAIDIFNAPLLLFSKDIIPVWQQSVKIFFDIVLSSVAIILLLPLILVLVIIIKVTSSGPIIYSQERIGKNGRIFNILKFRSMYTNSETEGPRLASRNDIRITPVGRFMRKRRLDEIPNFINVFKGDMSLVGPRPERAFFIEQIIEKTPQYSKLHLVKPGITSWGQVKYGYAENIEEMMQRMRYDLVYIENMSLYVDIQILIKTIGIIIKGQGI